MRGVPASVRGIPGLLDPGPVLPLLVFCGDFLVFSPCVEFLVFGGVLPSFQDFRGSVGISNFFFGGGELSPRETKERKDKCTDRRTPRARTPSPPSNQLPPFKPGPP